jgi:Cu+-exporting ATPase
MDMDTGSATAIDPACGMQVDATATNPLKTEHNGKMYFFCSRGCMLDFLDDPERYLEPSYQPSGMEGHDH